MLNYLSLSIFFSILPIFVSPSFHHAHADPKFLFAGIGILCLSVLSIKRSIVFPIIPSIILTLYVSGYLISFFFVYSLHRAFLFEGLTIGSVVLALLLPIRDKKDILIFLVIISASGLSPSIVLFLQGYGYKILDYLVWAYAPYVYGTFEYKCEVGQFFSIVTPITFGLSLYLKNRFVSLLFWLLFVLQLSSTIISHSRAGFWGSICGITFITTTWLLSNANNIKLLGKIIVPLRKIQLFDSTVKLIVLIIILSIAIKSFEFRLSNFPRQEDEKIKVLLKDFTENPISYKQSLRYIRLVNSSAIFKENPMGIGAGQFQVLYPKYKDSIYNDYEVNESFFPDNPHNSLIGILVEGGILSLIGYIFLIFYVFINLMLIIIPKSEGYQLAIILLGSILSLLFDSLFSYPLDRPAPSLFFFTILGLSFNLIGFSSKKIISKSNNIFKISIIVVGITASFFMIRASLATYFIMKYDNANSITQQKKVLSITSKLSPDYFPLLLRYISISGPFQIEKILRYHEIATKSYPTHPGLLEKMAKIYISKNMLNEAEEKINQLISIWPESKNGKRLRDTLIGKKLNISK